MRKPITCTRPLLRKGRLDPERTFTVKNSSGAPRPRPTGRVAFHCGGAASVARSCLVRVRVRVRARVRVR